MKQAAISSLMLRKNVEIFLEQYVPRASLRRRRIPRGLLKSNVVMILFDLHIFVGFLLYHRNLIFNHILSNVFRRWTRKINKFHLSRGFFRSQRAVGVCRGFK